MFLRFLGNQFDALIVPLLPQLGEEEICMSGMRLLCAKIASLRLNSGCMIFGNFVVIGFEVGNISIRGSL